MIKASRQFPSRLRTHPASWLRWLNLLFLALLVGCLQHPLPEPAPQLRGIVIPSPPPSYADMPWLEASFRGNVRADSAYANDARISMWDDRSGQGYFGLTKNAEFVLPRVGFSPHNNCLSLWADNNNEQTEIEHYQVSIQTDARRCSELDCSLPDQKGACLCFNLTDAGCLAEQVP